MNPAGKTIRLPLHSLESQSDFLSILKRESLQSGDKLEVVLPDYGQRIMPVAILVLIATSLYLYFSEKTKDFSDAGIFLKKKLSGSNRSFLEEEIASDYGIKLTLFQDASAEQSYWNQVAANSLAASYSDQEPDYEHLLSESNPDFKPNPAYLPWDQAL